ncbi:hypothetical protein DFAR_1370001 [Desulfarculales bacterium]
MEAACLRALAYGAFSSESVERIIDKELDKAPLLTLAPKYSPILHSNIRGVGYFLTAQSPSLVPMDRRTPQPVHPGQLGAGETATGAEPGYARSPGKPLRPRLHHRHRPSARGPVARNHQRSHPGRCHPRSPDP